MFKKNIHNELFNLVKEDVKRNINRNAFNDITGVFCDFIKIYDSDSQPVKWACNAAPGHGKTTVLIAFLKWLADQESKVPLLVALREKSLAQTIFNQVSAYKKTLL